MAELISMTYEQARAEHFKTLKDEAERKMNYWAARVYRSRPNDLNDPAHIRAGEYAAEYSYYKDALEALEDNRFQYETGFVKGFESAQPKWISVEERLPVFRRPVLRRMLNMTIKEMFDIMGESYMLCQTAEEACELGKASLKVVRAMEGKTPVSVKKARENLVEEIADVLVMVTVLKAGFLTQIESYDIEQEMDRKFDRFVDRIEKYRLEQTDEDPTN